MGVLPNGYKPAVALGSRYASSSSTNAYFDTGVYPKDTLRIESVFEGGGQVSSIYFFGARNTNSTTSNGQIGFGANTDGHPIIAYYNSQSTVFTDGAVGNAFYGKDGNELTYYTGYLSKTLVGSENAFTGTRTMYILARNNAGTPQYGGYVGLKRVRGVKIWDDDVLIREYLPAYEEATGKYGLYETVSASFVLKTGGNNDFIAMRPFTVSAADGGDAVIDDERFGEVREILVFDDGVYFEYVKVKAIPQQGYMFDYWEDNGTVVSRESEFLYGGDIDTEYYATSLTAHFVKKTDIRQDNGFRAMFFPYGGTAEGERDQTTNIFAKIKSASIVEDMMDKSVSTIVLDDMPSSITTDMPIIITDQLHKQVFIGIVKGINGNTLAIREPLSILDTDFFMDTDFDISGYSVDYFVERVLNQTILGILKLGALSKMNPFVVKKWSSFEVDYEVKYIYLDKRLNNLSNAPAVTSAEIVNAEDYILNLANDFVIVVKPTYLQNRDPLEQYWQWGGQAISLDVVNPNLYTRLTFGDNSEEIMNISIDVAEAEYTVLQVYNQAGTALRGIYAVKNDGTIAKVSEDIDINVFPTNIHDFIANEDCKVKVVNSNEQILLLKSQYLSNSFLNHKITFDVDLSTGVFRLEDFKVGRPVDFYYGNKLYKSMVTAREYYITEDNDDITTAHITLGKVRQSLTTKMNMRKKK